MLRGAYSIEVLQNKDLLYKASFLAMRLHSWLFHLNLFGSSFNHRVKLAKLRCLLITSNYPLQKMGKVKHNHSLLSDGNIVYDIVAFHCNIKRADFSVQKWRLNNE